MLRTTSPGEGATALLQTAMFVRRRNRDLDEGTWLTRIYMRLFNYTLFFIDMQHLANERRRGVKYFCGLRMGRFQVRGGRKCKEAETNVFFQGKNIKI